MRALGCRGSRRLLGATADGAVGTCQFVTKDSRLAPKPPPLSDKVARGDGGASSFFLVGRRLPAYIVLLVPELCRGRSLES